jgi:hypothetical protein
MRRVGQFGVVGLLILANVVLIGYAVAHHAPSTPVSVGSVVATPTINPSPSAQPAQKMVSAAKVPVVVEPVTLVSNYGTGVAWTAVGSCATGPNVAVSNDGGTTFIAVTQPAAHLLAIEATGPESAQIVGTDAACVTPEYFATSDDGLHWHAEAKAGSDWWQTPVGLRAPRKSITTPCPTATPLPVALGASGLTALVLCDVGVYRTSDGGAHWQPAGRLPLGARANAVAMGASGHGVVVLSHTAGCGGARAYSTSNAGRTWVTGTCLVVAEKPMVATMASNGTGLLLTAGGTYLTTDNGQTWD